MLKMNKPMNTSASKSDIEITVDSRGNRLEPVAGDRPAMGGTPAVTPLGENVRMHTEARQIWERETHTYAVPHQRLGIVLQAALAVCPGAILELGCGVGVLRSSLRTRAPSVRYFGCDVAASAVALISDPDVVQSDLNVDPVPFAGQQFDCVIGSGIMEYLSDVPNVLRQCRERLKPGGALVVSYYNMFHVWRQYERWRGREPHRHPTWANEYSFRELRQVLRDAGFRIHREYPAVIGLGHPHANVERIMDANVPHLPRRVPFQSYLAYELVFSCRALGAA